MEKIVSLERDAMLSDVGLQRSSGSDLMGSLSSAQAVSFVVVVVVVRMYIVGLLIIIIKLNGHHACYYSYVVYQYLIFY